MRTLSLWMLGLELTHFANNDDDADAVAGSLATVQSGSLQLSPYQGPAIQPYLGRQFGDIDVSIAPAISLRKENATAEDHSSDVVYVRQWRAQGRLWWTPDTTLLGIDVAMATGRAWTDNATVAEGPLQVELAPTLGLRGQLSESLYLVGRARWALAFADGDQSQHLGGAFSIEWNR